MRLSHKNGVTGFVPVLMFFTLFFQVQLQLLTAIVKLFLKKPTETQELVQQVLSLATQVRYPHGRLSKHTFQWENDSAHE